MAKRGRPRRVDIGEQMELLDVGPENLSKISPHIKRYRQAQQQRLAALKIECDEKEAIKELVKKSKLQRLSDGTIKFRCEGMLVIIEPRDEVIHFQAIDSNTKSNPDSEVKEKQSSMAAAVADEEKKFNADLQDMAKKGLLGPQKQKKKRQKKVKDLKP